MVANGFHYRQLRMRNRQVGLSFITIFWRSCGLAIAIPEHCTSAALTLLCPEAMFDRKAVRCAGGSPGSNDRLSAGAPWALCKVLRQFHVCCFC